MGWGNHERSGVRVGHDRFSGGNEVAGRTDLEVALDLRVEPRVINIGMREF